MNIYDAVRQQPRLSEEPGYKKWVEDGDDDALDEALETWGLQRDSNGDITDAVE